MSGEGPAGADLAPTGALGASGPGYRGLMTGEPPDGEQRRGTGFGAFFWAVMVFVVVIAVAIAVLVS